MEYRSAPQKMAPGSLQPELASPSERQVSGQSTNIVRREDHRLLLGGALFNAGRVLMLDETKLSHKIAQSGRTSPGCATGRVGR